MNLMIKKSGVNVMSAALAVGASRRLFRKWDSRKRLNLGELWQMTSFQKQCYGTCSLMSSLT